MELFNRAVAGSRGEVKVRRQHREVFDTVQLTLPIPIHAYLKSRLQGGSLLQSLQMLNTKIGGRSSSFCRCKWSEGHQ